MARPSGENLLLAPHFPAGLDRASGSMKVKGGGEISSAWKRDGDKVEWAVEIPAGVTVRPRLTGWSPARESLPETLTPGSHRWLLNAN